MNGCVSSCRHSPSTMNLYWWYLRPGPLRPRSRDAALAAPEHAAPASKSPPLRRGGGGAPRRQVHHHGVDARGALHRGHGHRLHPPRERAAQVHLLRRTAAITHGAGPLCGLCSVCVCRAALQESRTRCAASCDRDFQVGRRRRNVGRPGLCMQTAVRAQQRLRHTDARCPPKHPPRGSTARWCG